MELSLKRCRSQDVLFFFQDMSHSYTILPDVGYRHACKRSRGDKETETLSGSLVHDTRPTRSKLQFWQLLENLISRRGLNFTVVQQRINAHGDDDFRCELLQ
jgi:hypothetical protein